MITVITNSVTIGVLRLARVIRERVDGIGNTVIVIILIATIGNAVTVAVESSTRVIWELIGVITDAVPVSIKRFQIIKWRKIVDVQDAIAIQIF